MRLNEDLDSNQLSSIWKVFNNWPLMFLVSQQVRGTRGITVHKLFSLAEKWHQFLPDVFVVICLQENLTLYKAHILFSDYVEKSKKKNAKWVSKVIRSSVWTVDFIQKNACKKTYVLHERGFHILCVTILTFFIFVPNLNAFWQYIGTDN